MNESKNNHAFWDQDIDEESLSIELTIEDTIALAKHFKLTQEDLE